MKSSAKSLQRVLMILATIVALAVMALPTQQVYAAMGDYCIMPPYVKRDVKPNVMILMDNAADMGDPAYCKKSANFATDHLCTDTYSPDIPYEGYFKKNLKYSYDGSKFVPDSGGAYSGNLLNWVTMSKYDLLENLLVGGISTSRQTNVNILISKSNTWQKTISYTDSSGNSRSCVFNVNSANVSVSDPAGNGGACGYLDNPANPWPNDPGSGVASLESAERFADNSYRPDENYRSDSRVDRTALDRPGLLSRVMTAIVDFLVPSAEAASFHISGGPSSLTNGTECTSYNTIAISASGGSGAGYTWTHTGNFPPGLTLAGTGTPSTTISGVPTASGTYNFTIWAQDSAGNKDSKSYTITVLDATVTISPSLTSPLQQGYVGTWYYVFQTASAASVCGNYIWTVSAGALPPGLGLWYDAVGDLEIAGLPTIAGTYSFTLQVTDSGNNTASRSFTITINPSSNGLQITTSSPLQGGMVGQSYWNYIFTPPGSPGGYPYTWSIISGSLPPGLFFSYWASDNTDQWSYAYIFGTPTAAGTYTFTVQVSASVGQTVSQTFSLTIVPNPNPVRTSNLNVKVCAGNYIYNSCGGSLPTTYPWPFDSGCSESDHTQCILKSGLLDQFWPQARFGVMDFQKSGNIHAVPNVEICIQSCTDLPTTDPGYCPSPSSNFMTAVENAVAIDPVTTLVNGEYEAIHYYATGSGSGNYCNPYTNAQSCTKNFVLLLTSGLGADNPPNAPPPFTGDTLTANVYTPPAACTSPALSNLARNSCYGYNVGDLRADVSGRQYVTTYIVNTMGTFTTGPSYDPSTAPGANQTGNMLYQAAKYGGGTYYEATDATVLKDKLIEALQDIIKRAAAGTAASVLASGEGSGANLVQAVFYPRRQFGNDEVAWIGRLSNLWYYVDPYFASSNIREDDGDKVLHLKTDGTYHDYIAKLYFDSTTETTKAARWTDPNGDGKIGTQLSPDIDFESLGTLWEAGSLLWSRNLSTSPRTIYTSATGTTGLISFSPSNRAYLTSALTASTDSEAEAIIRWVSGEDTPFSPAISPAFTPSPDYRHRSVSIGGVGPYTWKLGDVLNSTPKISTWMPLSNYHNIYNDSTYGVPGQPSPSLQDAADISHYITSARYKGRGMIFAGANDGMLHAFRLGTLQLNWTGQGTYDKAKLSNRVCSGDSSIDCVNDAQCAAASAGTCSSTVTLGEEVWAFIPKNVLPYLKYMANYAYGGCHLYSVDLSSYVFDASIGDPASGDVSDLTRTPSQWRTILIGGMRYGGACRNIGTACNGGGTDCVKTPVDGLGFSSYFALDITNQNNPMLLWEYSNPDLGFTTAGPAIVRISASTGSPALPDKSKNGHWFVVLASGPTGPIDTSFKQFLGRSDQPLKLFVLNLKDGNLVKTIDNTGLSNAFAGSMYNATMDTDLDYQDNVVYVPYVKQATDGTWTDGGVGRIVTKQDPDPTNWYWSTLIDGIGPVTSAVAKLQNNSTHTLWTFFGTGRYYFEQSGTTDDGAGQRQIFGVKDPCFSISGFNPSCSSSSSLSWCSSPVSATTCGVITNVTSTVNIPTDPDAASFKGWYINLDADTVPDASLRAERVITDPLATSSGVVFFTTYKPYSDECALGGKSFIWAVKYNNGGGAGSLLQGQALVQVSTGSIEQVNLSSAFKDAGGRKSAGMEGVPPTAQGLSILTTPPPVKKVLHIRER